MSNRSRYNSCAVDMIDTHRNTRVMWRCNHENPMNIVLVTLMLTGDMDGLVDSDVFNEAQWAFQFLHCPTSVSSAFSFRNELGCSSERFFRSLHE